MKHWNPSAPIGSMSSCYSTNPVSLPIGRRPIRFRRCPKRKLEHDQYRRHPACIQHRHFRSRCSKEHFGMKSGSNKRLVRETQGNQLSRMVEACLRISQSFDYKDVLQEVVDSARSLTDAGYGALAVFDEDGAVEEFFTSGMTDEELQ